jgi:hypothetical protein
LLYSGGRDQEEVWGLRPTWHIVCKDPILKIPNTHKKGWVAQVVEHLPGKLEAMNLNPTRVDSRPKVIMIIVMGHECKETVWGRSVWGGGMSMGVVKGIEVLLHTYTYTA